MLTAQMTCRGDRKHIYTLRVEDDYSYIGSHKADLGNCDRKGYIEIQLVVHRYSKNTIVLTSPPTNPDINKSPVHD